MKYLIAIAVLISISGCATQQVIATPRTCQVVKVSDGDSITVNCGSGSERIRFCGIDAPEIAHRGKPAQPYGKEATDLVKRLLSRGQVKVVPVESDRYGRTVAELFVGNTFINAEIVKAGFGYEYKQYSKKCPNRLQIRSAEAIAQKNKVGVWNGGSYELPWDFRKRVKR
jgi:endonuclease YncB( thermonuclease family)